MSRLSEPLPTGQRVLRWTLWLTAGVIFGLLLGFAAALGAPRQEFAPAVGGYPGGGDR